MFFYPTANKNEISISKFNYHRNTISRLKPRNEYQYSFEAEFCVYFTKQKQIVYALLLRLTDATVNGDRKIRLIHTFVFECVCMDVCVYMGVLVCVCLHFSYLFRNIRIRKMMISMRYHHN